MQREAGFRMQGEDIAFSVDGARLASGTGHTSIDVFDATAGAWLRTIEEDDRVTCMSFSPTAISMLATATQGDAIHVWDIDSGEMIREIEGCSLIAIFSPDGRTIATASPVGRDLEGMGDLQLMGAESGEMRRRIVAHESFITCASWCPYNGSKLASGSHDGTCKVWDSKTGALLQTIELGDRTEIFCSMAWGRNWVLDTQRAMAFALGHQPRLGAGSKVLELEAGLVRMILDLV